MKGNLEALLQLTGKVESVGSPGGICTLVTMETPPQEYRLRGRSYRLCGAADTVTCRLGLPLPPPLSSQNSCPISARSIVRHARLVKESVPLL